MTTSEFKDLLEVNTKILTTQIEMSRELFSIKLAELKEDTQEIKEHAKETNGRVSKNNESIVILQEKQHQESKRRKRQWTVLLAAITTMFVGMMTYVVMKFSNG